MDVHRTGRRCGWALAHRVSSVGDNVVVELVPPGLDGNLTALSRICPTVTIEVDIDDARDAERAMSITISNFGRLDLLVNAPGPATDAAPCGNALLHVNPFGMINMTRAAAPLFRAQGEGHVFNMHLASRREHRCATIDEAAALSSISLGDALRSLLVPYSGGLTVVRSQLPGSSLGSWRRASESLYRAAYSASPPATVQIRPDLEFRRRGCHNSPVTRRVI
ncbi:SDR family oxidoreductase [Rhodococcus sovatensis]|uniref:SDR family oxidoreductase n=1 Tax=Rhodococcus sovatensis TaxID=1805840 RepID=A0ABZ2PLT7_9NOCA